jgi:sulfur carrier protein
MHILLNGQPRTIPDGSSLRDLLIAEGLHERRLAIEVNLDIIARAQHVEYRLKAGDRVEIVQAIGGG